MATAIAKFYLVEEWGTRQTRGWVRPPRGVIVAAAEACPARAATPPGAGGFPPLFVGGGEVLEVSDER